MLMISFDRRSQIVRYLQEHRRLSTRVLSQRLGVSEVTIRNDLDHLVEQGWVQRVHGGAELSPRMQSEQSFASRLGEHPAEKQWLAQAAVALVQPGDTILLDSSTTAFQLSMLLRQKSDLRVVTNNLQAAAALAIHPAIEVVLLGGVVRGKTFSVVGSHGVEMLAGLHVDKAFLSASGLTLARGLTDADIREVEIKRAMVRAATQAIVLLDASKLGQQSFLTFAELGDIHVLITDAGVPPEFVEACRRLHIQLVIV